MIWVSRKFWAIVLPFIILAVCHFFPQFYLNTDAAIGMIIVIAAYIVSVAADPGANAGTWFGVLASRKFWAAVVGLLVMVLDGFGLKLPSDLPPDSLVYLAAAISAYIGGVAIEGAKRPALPAQTNDVYNPEAQGR